MRRVDAALVCEPCAQSLDCLSAQHLDRLSTPDLLAELRRQRTLALAAP